MKTIDRMDVAHPTNPLAAPSSIEAQRNPSRALENAARQKAGKAKRNGTGVPTGATDPFDGYPHAGKKTATNGL